MDYSTILQLYSPSILEYFFLGIILLSFILYLYNPKEHWAIEMQKRFEYQNMPVLIPVPIITKDMGFWSAIRTWLFTRRTFELGEDFNFSLRRYGTDFIIPKGFRTDCASIPRFLGAFLSPTGLLLIPGIVHDYCYRTGFYPPAPGSKFFYVAAISRKESDIWFREIATSVNGFVVLNHIAYVALRLTGWWGWKGSASEACKILQTKWWLKPGFILWILAAVVLTLYSCNVPRYDIIYTY